MTASTGTPPVDVLIVTALQLERHAIRAHLRDVRIEGDSGLFADRGWFSAGTANLDIAVIETGAGNVDAAVLTSRAEELLRPKVIVMAGVAGGLKDVAIGDVVASSKVYWLESGKQSETFQPRPAFAPVSNSLVQLARAVATEQLWRERIKDPGGSWSPAGRAPDAIVAPIVAGEKVLADRRPEVARLAREFYGDALLVDMEDFGTLRGGHSTERARVVAVRGTSDLVEDKQEADTAGSQPLAAANAAAFVFELLTVDATASATVNVSPAALAELGAQLYPRGPEEHGLWARAGGDESRLQLSGPGFARWWRAAVLLDQGGGGAAISLRSLVAVMLADYPNNDALRRLSDG